MTNNQIGVTEGSGKNVATETLSGKDYQVIKIVGAQPGSTSVLGVNPDASINVSVIGKLQVSVAGGTISITPASVSGTVGASVIGTVPVTPSGTWVTSVVGGPLTLYAPTTSLVSGTTSIVTSTSQTSVLATAPGGQRYYVTQILVTNGSGTGTFVDIMDGPDILESGYAAANGGGFALTFPAPLRQNHTVQSLDMKARAQASIITNISGYTAP